MSAGYEILEHTADVGIRARGGSLAEALEAAARGLAELLGAAREGPGERRVLHLSAADPGALAVDLLNELLFLHETEGAGFGDVRVRRAGPADADVEVELVPLPGEQEGVGVKAATYHQLAVEERPDGSVELRVFLDV
ncbi:MAG TPA: archease [Actinomycetota bacterium]|nr:archease [Actinomycetota bacterium]